MYFFISQNKGLDGNYQYLGLSVQCVCVCASYTVVNIKPCTWQIYNHIIKNIQLWIKTH